MAGITSGECGGVVANDDIFPLGSKAGASTWERGNSSSPWWTWAVVQALVKWCRCVLAGMEEDGNVV
jgi:hypothetical protein